MRGSLFALEGFGLQDLGRLFLGRIYMCFFFGGGTGRDGRGRARFGVLRYVFYLIFKLLRLANAMKIILSTKIRNKESNAFILENSIKRTRIKRKKKPLRCT